MSYIPDTREDEDYKYSFLNKDDKDFIDGYDYCVEHAIDNFFDNLSDIEDCYLLHILNETLPPHIREQYEFYFYNKTSETRECHDYSDLFKKYLYEWIEKIRDEIITSAIDNMADEDYDRNRENYEKR